MALHTHTLPGRIWQVRPYPGGLALELRDATTRQVGYATLPLDGSPPTLLPVQDWWHGLEIAGHHTVYTHGYADPGSPAHMGIWAYSNVGKLLWQQPGLQLQYLSTTGLWALAPDGQAAHLHPHTGRPTPPDHTPLPLPQPAFPGVCVYTDRLWNEMMARIYPHLSFAPALQLEYLRHGEQEVWVAIEAHEGPAYTAHLLIVQGEQVQHRDVLFAQKEKIGLDSCLLHEGTLVYVRGDSTLCLWR